VSAEYPPDIDEFVVSGLTPIPATWSNPHASRSRAFKWSAALQVVHINDKPLSGSLVIGEVLRFHIADELQVDNFRVDPARLSAIGRMADLLTPARLICFESAAPRHTKVLTSPGSSARF